MPTVVKRPAMPGGVVRVLREDARHAIGPGEGMSWAGDGVTETRMVVRGRHAATGFIIIDVLRFRVSRLG
ncbi:hypothetical protein [Actinoplanes utahensis]|uniref:hypothetical protein n=1 Tax=Actinoplanes utahensis TaxID=1869 RepID=UPI00126A367F|nr:hypothetical protein [Actinoplanes utahensis]GIF33853.1 hypothetical protein Aut01nite_68390 [Actinoplanes utahensis]